MRKNFFCKLLTFILLTVVGCVTLIRCGGSGNETPEADEFDVSFVLPSRIEAAPEGLIEFVVKDGKAPLQLQHRERLRRQVRGQTIQISDFRHLSGLSQAWTA